jgi:hypothetical protein
MTNNGDTSRKWLWVLLAAGVAIQLYFVQEVLVALAIFAAIFAGVTLLIAGFLVAHKVWEAGVSRLLASQSPVVTSARRAVAVMEEVALRPFRRPV